MLNYMRNMALMMLASSIFLVSADCGGLPVPSLTLERVAWNGIWSSKTATTEFGDVELTLTETTLGNLTFSINGTAKIGDVTLQVSGRENLPSNTYCDKVENCWIMGNTPSQVLLDFYNSSQTRLYQLSAWRVVTNLDQSKTVNGTLRTINSTQNITANLSIAKQ